jgi:hypothetical protein
VYNSLHYLLLQTPQIGTEDGDGGAIGERSYLEILNKSSDIEKEPLTILKQIQQQLRMDSERLDRVSRVLCVQFT